MRIGILTAGGDCPGLNAVIRGFAKYVYNQIPDAEIIGISDGYRGLINGEFKNLKESDFSGILNIGGTILGTSCGFAVQGQFHHQGWNACDCDGRRSTPIYDGH